MAHELQAADPLIVLDYSECPAPVGLVPGKIYRLTGLSQGSLGNYDLLATANTTTQFSDAVQVFPALAPTLQTGWPGIFDFEFCQLTYLHDAKNNQVEDGQNISNFPWFPASAFRVNGNVVSNSANLDLGGNAYSGQFENNVVRGGSNVSVSGAALLSADLHINDNTFDTAQLAVTVPIVVRLHITGNIVTGSNLAVSGLADVGDAFVNNNHISAFGTIEVGDEGSTTIINNVLNGGYIFSTPPVGAVHSASNNTLSQNGNIQLADSTATFAQVAGNWVGNLIDLTGTAGSIAITNNVIGPDAELTVTAGHLGFLSVFQNVFYGTVELSALNAGGSLQVDNSAIFPAGNSFPNYDFRYIAGALNADTNVVSRLTQLAGARSDFEATSNAGLVENVTIGPAGFITASALSDSPQLTRVYVENGTLEYEGQAADNIRLQGEDSTLVIPVSNAKKDGYAGALP